MSNNYIIEQRKKELLAHFEKRFAGELKEARENCDAVHVHPHIKEGKGGKLVATVQISWVRAGKSGEQTAHYEYLSQSPSRQQAGWYCSYDWHD